jgi:nitronate monooxygenase
VFAAGGIADGRGLAAALMLGVQACRRERDFYASQEAEGIPRRSAASRRHEAATPCGRSFSTGRSVCGGLVLLLRNRHAETWLGGESELAAEMEDVGREYAVARERGDFDVAGVIAGEAWALIHDIPPVGA